MLWRVKNVVKVAQKAPSHFFQPQSHGEGTNGLAIPYTGSRSRACHDRCSSPPPKVTAWRRSCRGKIFTPKGVRREYCDEHVCLSVCLSVYLSVCCTRISGTTCTTRSNYIKLSLLSWLGSPPLSFAVMRCILPVLWITPCFPIIGQCHAQVTPLLVGTGWAPTLDESFMQGLLRQSCNTPFPRWSF